jgi:hypothetical protein
MPMNQRCSIFLYPGFLAGVLIQRRLNRRSQSALVAFFERDESERLLCLGDRTQHFYWDKHRSGVGQEHQFDAGTPIQHV